MGAKSKTRSHTVQIAALAKLMQMQLDINAKLEKRIADLEKKFKPQERPLIITP